MRRFLFLFLFALTAGGFARAADLAPVKSVIPCEALAKQDLAAAVGASVKIAKAAPVGAFCRVEGTIAPEIGFEVNLPVEGWQQRYLQTGCGGLCGMLSTHLDHAGTCAPAQQAGLVVASDDMGHRGMAADFGTDPQKRIDFAYRGNHLTALAAKALIKAFYGQAPKFSYFAGCSDGGREALVEAERYPDDFNGITAGAPALNFQVQNSFYHAWQTVSNTGPDGRAILVADRLPILHKAVLAACGDAEGLVEDPRACHFDPATIQCKGSDTSACLTEAEVTTARRFYQGPTDAAGQHFTIGGPQYGSELSWAGVYVPRGPDEPIFSRMIASGSSQFVIFPEVSAAEGDVAHFAFTQAHFAQLKALHPLYDGGDTDLARFDKAGGKLILWHGWSDPHISPINTIAYYQGVAAKLGKDETTGFARLFLFPGLYHCGGGDGYTQFDMLSAIIDWVENRKAPDTIIAAQVAPAPEHRGPPPGMGGPRTNPPPLPEPDQPALKTRTIKAYALEDKPQTYAWEGGDLIGPDFQKVYGVKDGTLVAE